MKRGLVFCATRPTGERGAECCLCGSLCSYALTAEVHTPGEPARTVCGTCRGALALVVERPGVVLFMDDPIDQEAATDWGRPASRSMSYPLRARRRDFGDAEGGEHG